MKNIFEKGDFSGYQIDSLNEAVGTIKTSYYAFAEKKTTIFIIMILEITCLENKN